jgi:hypothetical protein
MTTSNDWKRDVQVTALASKVLAVAATRIEGTWKAYVDAVPGMDHDKEWEEVLRQGCPLMEDWARGIFPRFKDMKYAR